MRNPPYTWSWVGYGTINNMIDSVDSAIETPEQLGAVEIAGNLRRLVDRLAVPDRDPMRLRRQLLDAQRALVASLIDLNAIVGGPALLAPTGQRDGASASAATGQTNTHAGQHLKGLAARVSPAEHGLARTPESLPARTDGSRRDR